MHNDSIIVSKIYSSLLSLLSSIMTPFLTHCFHHHICLMPLFEICVNMFQIFVIRNYAFQIPNRLELINIRNNRISIIKKHAFGGLNHLRELHLERNEIKEIYLADIPAGAEVFLNDNDIHDLSQLHDATAQGSYGTFQYQTQIKKGNICVENDMNRN